MTYIEIDANTWNTTSGTVNTGKTDNDNITNDILQAINNLANDLGTISFINNTQLLIAALDDFGNNMAGALACVGVDLQVVASGLGAAALAFKNTDQALAQMFAHLDTELGYYTSTATSVQLATPTAAQQAALNALPTDSSAVSSSANWLNLTNVHPQPPNPAIVGIGIVILLCIGALALA